MPNIACPSCSTPIDYPEESAGTRFFCMACDHEFRLPGEPVRRADGSMPAGSPLAQSERITAQIQATLASTETPERDPTHGPHVRATAVLLVKGYTPDAIKVYLKSEGSSEEAASAILAAIPLDRARAIVTRLDVDTMAAARAASRTYAMSNVIFGSMWLAGGILVTLFSIAIASGKGGGSYVLAWGAILFGGVQLQRGISQLYEQR